MRRGTPEFSHQLSQEMMCGEGADEGNIPRKEKKVFTERRLLLQRRYLTHHHEGEKKRSCK